MAARLTRLSRRSVVLLGTGVVLGGCGGAGPTAAPSQVSPSVRASGRPSARHSPTAAPLPRVAPWRPSENDLVPAAKLAAVRHVERMVTTRSRVVEVIDAQYGGLLPSAASVLVVTRTWRRAASGGVLRGGATYDVRVSRRRSGWRVTEVYPSRPGPPARVVSSSARRVLASDRIDLPPAARADVLSGHIQPVVLEAMLQVAAAYPFSVSVLRSGHPLHVFGTDRLSDHPRGLALDTWAVEGRAVVDPRTPRSLVTGFMHALADAGSDNVGGPYLLGPAPQWFSDPTHHDHVHAGFG